MGQQKCHEDRHVDSKADFRPGPCESDRERVKHGSDPVFAESALPLDHVNAVIHQLTADRGMAIHE